MSKTNPKVFFTNSFLESCHYVRALIPMRAIGADGDKTSLRTERISENQRAQAVLDADVVVFHRPNDDRSLEIARMLKTQGKKVVMDNDDTYKGFDMAKLGKLFPKIDKAIDDFAREADLITCSTEFLRQEYLKLNPNVTVLKNCVDLEDWPEVDEIERNDGETVRIGLVGSVGLKPDLGTFQHVLDSFKDRKDITFVVFALPVKNESTTEVQKLYRAEYELWEHYQVEWHPFVPMKDYVEKLNNLKLDLLLIPRSDDYFNRCKSNLKFLEASMLEIPCIVQGFEDGNSPYQVNPQDAEHMEIIVDNSDWIEVIEKYIMDKELRGKVGKKAREYVVANYNIEDHAHLWTDTYKKLLNG